MSILINLLPDVRQAKLRDRHRRQLFTGVSILIWVICTGVVLALGFYNAGQAFVINSQSNKIASQKSKLQNVTGLTTALTAENNLASLPSLYQQRVLYSKFFTILQATAPNTISITSLTVDTSNNLNVQGTASNYRAIATLARAMESANVGVDGNSSIPGTGNGQTPYFTNVAITSAGNASGVFDFTITAVVGTGVVSASN